MELKLLAVLLLPTFVAIDFIPPGSYVRGRTFVEVLRTLADDKYATSPADVALARLCPPLAAPTPTKIASFLDWWASNLFNHIAIAIDLEGNTHRHLVCGFRAHREPVRQRIGRVREISTAGHPTRCA